MSERFVSIRLSVIGLLLLAVGISWLPVLSSASSDQPNLTVRFLSVGQGDAILIETPDGVEVLIDGGPTAAVLRELFAERSFFDRSIDLVIATHPDTDHVAGLVDVLERFSVARIMESGAAADSPAALAFASAASKEGAELITAQAGQVLQLGASTTLRILSPQGDSSDWPSNNASVIVQVVYGETAFMLTGDAPLAIEEYLAGAYGAGLKSNVLKLGHHGSKTSSSELFLETVSPEYAVVSAGAENRYGHPNAEVVARAGSAGAQIVSTIDQGTITFKSDGKEVWVE